MLWEEVVVFVFLCGYRGEKKSVFDLCVMCWCSRWCETDVDIFWNKGVKCRGMFCEFLSNEGEVTRCCGAFVGL